MRKAHRDTIKVEVAEVLAHEPYAGSQYILRVKAPKIARTAQAGQFAHIQCSPNLPMRRPLSIMRANKKTGSLDFLYKIVGAGTQMLSTVKPPASVDIMAPIGQPFKLDPSKPRALLLGGGVGIPPMIFLAETMRQAPQNYKPLVLMGSEVPFPFKTAPSKFMVPGIPADTIAALPLIEDWGYASRLSSSQGYPGCYQGYVTDLARGWLKAMTIEQHAETCIYACGPHAMLKAAYQLATEFGLACHVSLEELMACAVGGCAGCVVEIVTDGKVAMKRVCVDGPVFAAHSVVEFQ